MSSREELERFSNREIGHGEARNPHIIAPRPQSQPGAYANGPPGGSRLTEEERFADPLDEQEHPQERDLNNDMLAVATVIDESRPLQQAEEFGEEERNDNKSNRSRILTLPGLAVIIGVVVFLSVLLGRDDPASDSASLRQPTATPSSSPTQTLEGYLLSLFASDTVQNIAKPSSPQAKAYEWIAEDMTLLLPDHYSADRILQRYAMATFFYSTGGDSWTRNDNWLDHTTHECAWYSSGSFGSFRTQYVDEPVFIEVEHNNTCEIDPRLVHSLGLLEAGTIQHIWLPYNNLGGEFPQELFWLTNLRSINVDGRQFGGTFPAEVVQLTNLETLLLNGNQLVSTIPSSIGSALANLTTFSVSYNMLEGTVRMGVSGKSNSMRFWLIG